MSAGRRAARLKALAKINLDLRVIRKRPDGFHEIRTIFQTISLGDEIDLSFIPSASTHVELDQDAAIDDNLVIRAARLCLEAMEVSGEIAIRLRKQVPMGSGLGGGSSDAAAVLLALPALAGRSAPLETLLHLAASLGSDVPFFLLGGTALGIGRGEEVYPLPDRPPKPGILLLSGLHISTAEAYRALGGRLTTESSQNKIDSFGPSAWSVSQALPVNDFEQVAFEQFPQLKALKQRLLQEGAESVLMSGSGSAVWGLFRTPTEASRALQSFREDHAVPISLVSRAQYRSMWWRRLQEHTDEKVWPPRSRYL
ncbi:MAG: 4-(cytidine 5'-diphospho)-2-C-methyl-D-erythritol kinase [Bryobacteraceae bacterium]